VHEESSCLEIGGGEGAESAARGGGRGRGPGAEPEGGARHGSHRRPPYAVLSTVAGGSNWGPVTGRVRPPSLARSRRWRRTCLVVSCWPTNKSGRDGWACSPCAKLNPPPPCNFFILALIKNTFYKWTPGQMFFIYGLSIGHHPSWRPKWIVGHRGQWRPWWRGISRGNTPHQKRQVWI
jgi:hypothetical protein